MRDPYLINKRAIKIEAEIAKNLIEMFGEIRIHIQEPFELGSLNRWDFVLYAPGQQKVYIDVFYAKNNHSMVGSIISKKKKIEKIKNISSMSIVLVCISPEKIRNVDNITIPDNIYITDKNGLFNFLKENYLTADN